MRTVVSLAAMLLAGGFARASDVQDSISSSIRSVPEQALDPILVSSDEDGGLGVRWTSPHRNRGALGDAPVNSHPTNQEGGKQGRHLAQVDRSESTESSSSSPSVQTAIDNASVAEVLVTAQKRSERIQDVPVSLTVLDTGALAEHSQNRLQDYYATVPSLNLTAGGSGTRGGSATLAIRGLTTGGQAGPTVGLTIDDIPYGSSTGVGLGAAQSPDIDPSDLARIEVLRGPQGTLYGASSLGGLVKFVTVDPSTDKLSGNVQVLANDVKNGEHGYGVRGAINLPLSDTFAMRLSAFKRRDPGYVDNITTGQKHVNQADIKGGRVSAFWNVSDTLSVKLAAMLQDTNGDGDAFTDIDGLQQPLLGDLKQARLRGTGKYDVKSRLYSATVKAKFGNLDFTSLSGYAMNKYSVVRDATNNFGFFSDLFFGVSGAGLGTFLDTKKFSQEFRLASADSERLEWLVGAFYTNEDTPTYQTVPAIDPLTGTAAGLNVLWEFPTTFSEYALFADLTVHVTDRFEVQFGGRESRNKQKYDETDTGPFVPVAEGFPTPLVYETERTKESSFTYLLSPQFRISPNMTVYTRFASGYRAGGPNFTAILFKAPVEYNSDKTYSYELGAKGQLLDRALTFDASVYYIDWKNLQLSLTDPASGLGYFGNGGNAKSQGLELSVQARSLIGLSIGATGAYNDAKLTQDLPPLSSAFGQSGDRLPFSSRYSGSLSANQVFPLAGNITGFIGGLVSYVGSRADEFSSGPTEPRRKFPSYTQLDLRIGAQWQSATVSLFANNVTDKRGILSNISLGGGNRAVEYIQPRTIGVSVVKDFE